MDHKVLFDSVEVVHYEEKKTPPVLIEDICEKNQRLISKNTASKSAFATARYHLKLKFKTSSENNKKRQRPTVIPASTDLCPTNWIFFYNLHIVCRLRSLLWRMKSRVGVLWWARLLMGRRDRHRNGPPRGRASEKIKNIRYIFKNVCNCIPPILTTQDSVLMILLISSSAL